MQLKTGRFGKYFACTNEECKNTRKLLRNGEVAPPKADPIHMPDMPCEKTEGYFILRDGAAGIFLASSAFPKSRETRAPKLFEILPHCAEFDPKFKFLCDGPVKDNEGNPTIVRFSRKAKEQYLMTEEDGKATGWTAHYRDGKWEIEKPAKKKKAATKKSSKKKAAKKKTTKKKATKKKKVAKKSKSK
jgi:DNA topoisomerase-1